MRRSPGARLLAIICGETRPTCMMRWGVEATTVAALSTTSSVMAMVPSITQQGQWRQRRKKEATST